MGARRRIGERLGREATAEADAEQRLEALLDIGIQRAERPIEAVALGQLAEQGSKDAKGLLPSRPGFSGRPVCASPRKHGNARQDGEELHEQPGAAR